MNIHLFSINSTHNELLKSTFEILKNFKGQFEFVLNTDYNLNIKDKSFNSFDSLFDICDDFRKNNNILATDIAILISPLTHKEYFSLYNSKSKNIFVCTEHWELFSNAEKKILLAHQCIENVLQCLSNFEKKNAHIVKSIGCINDMCNEKTDITLKLRTADICPPCIDLFLNGGLTNTTLFQSIRFLEKLRTNFLLQESYNKNLKPLTLCVKKNIKNNLGHLEIHIGNQKIDFTKTELFLYYILCDAKETGNDFSKAIAEKKKNSLGKTIYNINDRFLINSMDKFWNLKSVKIESYFEGNYTNVAKNVTIINNKMIETLGFNLAKFYTIKKRQPDIVGIKEKLTKVLEELNKQMDQLHLDKLLDKKDKANKKKKINASIISNTKLINLQRGENLPYIIELFTRKDYEEYFKLDIN